MLRIDLGGRSPTLSASTREGGLEGRSASDKRRWLALLLCTALLAAACRDHSQVDTAPNAQEFAELTAPYPKGGWRLARHRLQHAALTFSHILVRHEQSVSDTENFRAPNWDPDEVSKRTPNEARSIAAKLAKQLQAEPERFEEFVVKYSDDVVTRDRHGSFGTWSANLIPPALLDALQTMSVGQVSRVVQSDFGFHVLMLRANPAPLLVSARRIVIGYAKTAPSLMRQGRATQRSRTEALDIAREVAAKARQDPSSFPSLVDRYSDHSDALRGGDIGTWSNQASHMMSREIELIGSLRVGQVSDPIDSPEGICVFLRDPLQDREELAWERLDVGIAYRGASPTDQALPLRSYADKLLAELRKEPAKFDRMREVGCCSGRDQNPIGRGAPQVEVALRGVPPDAFAAEPVELNPDSIIIVRRAQATAPLAEPDISGTLPKRSEPDIAYLVQNATDGSSLAAFVQTMHESVAPSLGLPLERSRILDGIVLELKQGLQSSEADRRMALIDSARRQIRERLGADVERPYYQRLVNEIARQLM